MFTTVGSPIEAFVDGVRAILVADATLTALVTGVYGHLSEAARVAYPYVVLGRRTRQNDAGTMQIGGGHVTLQVDIWSAKKGSHEAEVIGSRIVQVLERAPVRASGYTVVAGSLSCELDEVFDEPDEDKPGARLYHGVQRWTAEIHESL